MKVAVQRNGRQRGKSVPLKAVSILRLCAMLLLTPRNYAGCQIERCTHQSRDEPFGTNSHIYQVGRGYCAVLTHLLQKKRLFLSEIGVYLSLALAVEGFWAYERLATAPVIPDQHGGYYPPTPLRLGYRRRYQKYRANRHFRKPNWIPSKKRVDISQLFITSDDSRSCKDLKTFPTNDKRE
jgi:hypothetical protein